MSALAESLVDGGYDAVEALGEAFSHVSGRVVPYDTWADCGLFIERFQRGAFTASLAKRPQTPLLLWHDNRSFPIGHAVEWDDRHDGLHGRFKLAMSAMAQYAAQQARDDFLTGMSVGFGPVRSSWVYAGDWNPDLGPDHLDKVTRHEARLLEVSLTPTPAYADAYVTSVEAQSLDGSTRSDKRNYELYLRQLRQHPPGH
jgi:HK97 family phage prohead protease